MLDSKGQNPETIETAERLPDESAERRSVEAVEVLPSAATEGRTNIAAEPLSNEAFQETLYHGYTWNVVGDDEDGSRNRSVDACLLQKSIPVLAPETVAKIKGKLFSLKVLLPDAVLQTIIEELRTDGPIKRTFEPICFGIECDPRRSNVGATFRGFTEKASGLVPKEKADRVLDKWLGQTARQKRVSLEVLGQMSQLRHAPEIKRFPSFLLRVLASRQDEMYAELTTEMAKELCNDWNPVCESSDAYQDSPSPEELSSVAKGLVDMLGDGLQPDQPILPEYRWNVSQYGWTHSCC